jgi:hypothetical protein
MVLSFPVWSGEGWNGVVVNGGAERRGRTSGVGGGGGGHGRHLHGGQRGHLGRHSLLTGGPLYSLCL